MSIYNFHKNLQDVFKSRTGLTVVKPSYLKNYVNTLIKGLLIKFKKYFYFIEKKRDVMDERI